MRYSRTTNFDKQLRKLPPTVTDQFVKQSELLLQDKRHPSLHFKKLQGENDVYSIRLANRYRALFILTPNNYVFFSIGHRKNIYR
jgi:mRNA-degrading endonuclease RelE of RelBE toxin-antitoxin system